MSPLNPRQEQAIVGVWSSGTTLFVDGRTLASLHKRGLATGYGREVRLTAAGEEAAAAILAKRDEARRAKDREARARRKARG